MILKELILAILLLNPEMTDINGLHLYSTLYN
jgi:hypothetical protein